MKKVFVTLLSFFLISLLAAQNLTGTWQGFFTAYRIQADANQNSRRHDMSEGRVGLSFDRKFYFVLELKQSYKAVWGVYNTTDSANHAIGCVCSISGVLPKKQGAIFDLYKEKVVDHDPKILQQVCDAVNRITFHYFVNDGKEYLVGKWFTGDNSSTARDGSSGAFLLQHVNVLIKNNVDEYFPKLDKLLSKGTTTDTLALKTPSLLADTFQSLNIDEKEIINSMINKK
jgi:hypothetical protein